MKSLRSKILSHFLPLILIPVTISVAASTWVSTDMIKKEFKSRLNENLRSAEFAIALEQEKIANEARALAWETEFITAVKEDDEQKLLGILEQSTETLGIERGRFIRRDGKVMANARYPAIYGNVLSAEQVRKALEGSVFTGIVKTKVGICLDVAVPVRDGGTVLGALELAELIDYGVLSYIKGRHGLDMMVIDGNRPQASTFSDSTVIRDALSQIRRSPGKPDTKQTFDHINLGGEPFYAIVKPIMSENAAAGYLLMAIPYEPVNKKIAQLLIYHALFFAILALIAVIFSQCVAGRVTKPLKILTSMADEISKGNLCQKADIKSRDEIEVLSDSFNRMTAALAESSGELELRMREVVGLNRALQKHATELEAAYRDMESFSYAISHDLKAPVRRIKGFSEIVSSDYADRLDLRGRDLVRRIGRSADNMNNLIGDLLEYSKLGSQSVNKVRTDIVGLAKSVYDELRPADRNVRLEIGAIPEACCDELLMRQLLLNLLSNAIKFTRDCDTAVIEFRGYTERNQNVFYVRDNGIGFDMQYKNKLFGLFQRIHADKSFEGTGVGLVIVKKIIEKQGGRVWAEGKPDEGATFYFSLPVQGAGCNETHIA